MGRRKAKKELKNSGLPATRRQRRKTHKRVWKEMKKSPLPATHRQRRKWEKKSEREFNEDVITPLTDAVADRLAEARETGRPYEPLTVEEVFPPHGMPRRHSGKKRNRRKRG